MAANNTAALAALKAARNSVYAELAAHNNIDTTATKTPERKTNLNLDI